MEFEHIEHDEIQALKKEIFHEADERYVKIAECNQKQEKVNERFASDHEQIALILQKQEKILEEQKNGFKVNNWLTTAVLGAIIAAVIAFYFFTT